MRNSFKLRKVVKGDWKILLEWRNDKTTRKNSLHDELISIDTHKDYIKNALANPNRTLYIMEYNKFKDYASAFGLKI